MRVMFLKIHSHSKRLIQSLILVSLLAGTPKAVRLHPRNLNEHPKEGRSYNTSVSLLRHLTVNVNIPSSPDGHLVTDPLPLTKDGEELNTRHWAGHLPASDDKQKYFFYWLFEPENPGPDTPLLIWLNGGPACSSMDGLFLENGPIQWTVVDGKYMLQQNPYSWHKAPAYTLYIDQPVGTGLSFTTNNLYPRNDEEVNIDFYYFLTSFLDFHADKFVTEGVVNRPVFFSGESHAGHYIPSMMNYILKKNNNDTSPMIPLGGAAIGNGWMDPIYQYAAAEAAYGHGLVDFAQVNALSDKEKTCQDNLKKGNYRSNVCFDLLDTIVAQSYGKDSAYTVSQYDVRVSEKKGAPRTFPRGHKVTECYLGGHRLPEWETASMRATIKDSVLEALHASAATAAGQVYEECTDPPYHALAHQDGKGVVDDIVAVLEDSSKPRLLFFNGVEDLICNHVGNEKVLENLPWKGRDAWMTSKRYAWMSVGNDQPAGFMKEYDNLLFLKLLNAGHMVPMDLPETSLRMMSVFMSEGSFRDSMQDIASSLTPPPDSCPICSTCPDQEDCSEAIAVARKKFLTEHPAGNAGSFSHSISFAWALPLVGMFLLLVVVISWRKRREERQPNTPTDADNLEMQTPQYQDDPNEHNDEQEDARKEGPGII